LAFNQSDMSPKANQNPKPKTQNPNLSTKPNVNPKPNRFDSPSAESLKYSSPRQATHLSY